MPPLKTSVVICGAGPAGLTLAHLLGQHNIDVTLIERLPETVTEPRAISIDGESLRTLQQIDMFDKIEGDILQGLTSIYENAKGTELFRVGSPETKPFGYATINSFDQPTLDRLLANELQERDTVKVYFNTQLESFSQDANGVTVNCLDHNGKFLEIQADYLIGADGGRSTIRSLLGIKMSGESNPQPWLVIDTIDPYLDTDSDMNCKFFCDPSRPGMTLRKQHGERRWEWMVTPEENREDLLQEENIHKIISRYTDVTQVTIYRKRVFDFHAIVADCWQDKRVFLVGDAAHMTPPFAGQGLNSGFRDVANLAWKLTAVVKHHANPAILDSYELERRDHAKALIETAVNLGNQIQPLDPIEADKRDAFFEAINKDPEAVRNLEDSMASPILQRHIEQGLINQEASSAIAGQLLRQPNIKTPDGEITLLDNILGNSFSILGFNCDPKSVLDEEILAQWLSLDTTAVSLYSSKNTSNGNILMDEQELFLEWIGDTEPKILLIRPDRFCMLATKPELASEQLLRCKDMLFR